MNGLLEAVLTTCEKIVAKCERNENDILVATGTVCSIGAVIMACVATHKSEKIIKETKEKAEELADRIEEEPEEVKKELVKTGGKAIVEIGILYGVTAGLEIVSLRNFKKSNDNYKADALAMSSIAASATQTLMNYRRMMKEKIGAEAEEEAYYGVEKKSVSITEDGKTKKKKVRIANQPPANHSVLCFAPWTSPLYVDEELLECPGVNRDRIRSSFKMLNIYLTTSKKRYLSTNDIADELQIANTKDWYVEGRIFGEGALEYHTREVYELYEGRYIPIYYIEVNCLPNLPDRLQAVLPEAPVYAA